MVYLLRPSPCDATSLSWPIRKDLIIPIHRSILQLMPKVNTRTRSVVVSGLGWAVSLLGVLYFNFQSWGGISHSTDWLNAIERGHGGWWWRWRAKSIWYAIIKLIVGAFVVIVVVGLSLFPFTQQHWVSEWVTPIAIELGLYCRYFGIHHGNQLNSTPRQGGVNLLWFWWCHPQPPSTKFNQRSKRPSAELLLWFSTGGLFALNDYTLWGCQSRCWWWAPRVPIFARWI